MTDPDLVRVLFWALTVLSTGTVGVIVFGVRRHLENQRTQTENMRALESTAITTTQFTGFAQRIDKRLEKLQTHFDGQVSELRNDNRKIVASVVELLKK